MTKVKRVPSHRARQRRRVPRRVYLAAAVGLAVLAIAVTGRYLVDAPGPVRTDALTHRSGPCAAGHTAGSCRAAATPAALAGSSQPAAAATSRAAATRRTAARPEARQTPAAPAATPTGSASAAPAPSVSAAADGVLTLINQARAQAGLPAYTILSGLQVSSGKHNQLMADGCGLSHQCPGEPGLGARETAAGVQWSAAGENIGEGGPVADTQAAVTQMAVALTQDMLNEKPPDDGHRLNILSSAFTHIGIAVFRSGNGTVWMTQDFAN
jgi:uncharacterized protein YkwD